MQLNIIAFLSETAIEFGANLGSGYIVSGSKVGDG